MNKKILVSIMTLVMAAMILPNAVLATNITANSSSNPYDVNDDTVVDDIDVELVWANRVGQAPYNEIYDVNKDGRVNFQDAGLVNKNRFNPYDVNGDKKVDDIDIDLVWANRVGQAPYNEIYDVNKDGTVNYQDAGLVHIHRYNPYDVNLDGTVDFDDVMETWNHRSGRAPFEHIYDVNDDGKVNFQDAGLCWVNRG